MLHAAISVCAEHTVQLEHDPSTYILGGRMPLCHAKNSQTQINSLFAVLTFLTYLWSVAFT